MDGLDRLDQFDLGAHGDRHEREFWPLLAKLFPSYEILWRRLIVGLICRIDPKSTASPEKWIRLRPGIPAKYEQASMAHYSVFYFLGRAVKRRAEEKTALDYPEDVLFLLDSVGDNLKHFRRAMNDLGADCGRVVFRSSSEEAPPFGEISAYRDTFLHNPVIGRGVTVEKTSIPKWSANKSASPLERAKTSWRAVEQLPLADMIGTDELLDRLIREVGSTLESWWQTALSEVMREPFLEKMVKVTRLAVQGPPTRVEWVGTPGAYSSMGSNTTFAVPSASGNYSPNRTVDK